MSLKEFRKRQGLSVSELSEKSGVSLRMIQKYESGERNINGVKGETLYRLAKVLGCSMEDLIVK